MITFSLTLGDWAHPIKKILGWLVNTHKPKKTHDPIDYGWGRENKGKFVYLYEELTLLRLRFQR